MNWDQIVEYAMPYVFKIDTPTGGGTGFLCLFNEDRSFCGVATAAHVVDYAEEWQQPIRLHHEQTGEVRLLQTTERVIYKDYRKDSAVILFPTGDLVLPEQPMPMLPTDRGLSLGIEVGWLGFPAIAPYTLCFFSGNVSARQEYRSAYLIDGVAINGVSGGPVLWRHDVEGIQVVGIITAYSANRERGDALPGLSVAQDVSQFHDVVSQVKSMDEAQRQKVEMDRAQADAPGQPPGSDLPPPAPESK